MRYDWSRAPWLVRVPLWLMTLLAPAAVALFLWDAATRDWTLVFPALLIGGGTVVMRLSVRKAYGAREAVPAVPVKRLPPMRGQQAVIPRPVPKPAAGQVAEVMDALGYTFNGPDPAHDLNAARSRVLLGPCAHTGAVPVDSLVTGERLAWLCVKCDAQLPAEWR